MNKLLKMANRFNVLAQILPMGTSTKSDQDKTAKLKEYKSSIENAHALPIPGWSNPGNAALNAINKILAGQTLTSDEIQSAINDINSNYHSIDINDFKDCLT